MGPLLLFCAVWPYLPLCRLPRHISPRADQGLQGTLLQAHGQTKVAQVLDISVINANTPLALPSRVVVVLVLTINLPSFFYPVNQTSLFLKSVALRLCFIHSFKTKKSGRAVLTFLFTRKIFQQSFPVVSTHEKIKIVYKAFHQVAWPDDIPRHHQGRTHSFHSSLNFWPALPA